LTLTQYLLLLLVMRVDTDAALVIIVSLGVYIDAVLVIIISSVRLH